MITLTRPAIDQEKIDQINQILATGVNRSELSRQLCELWGWKSPSGQLKDISCRDMLRALDRDGIIQLPPPKSTAIKAGQQRVIQYLLHDLTPVCCSLKDITPLVISIVESGDLPEFKSFIDQYHYLGFDRTVGENMKYMVRTRDGVPVACLLFGSAAWSCRDRDEEIGWEPEERKRNLSMLTNNTRFLIFPWVHVDYLASHILSRITRRIREDWQNKYGHPVVLLETFVETGRFHGTCYKAANWICVGKTTGRGRNDRDQTANLPVKDVYLYPLVPGYRSMLLK